MKKGSLVVVGTGILTPAHLSQESIARIKTADVVHFLVPDPLGMPLIKKLNQNIKNLAELYYDEKTGKNGENRLQAYDLMVDSILQDVRSGKEVCAVFYGHPGVFVYPSHRCIGKAENEGYDAIMLPAISAQDCLYSDLNIDPGKTGCQSLEATQYLFYKHPINPFAGLILWQITVVGDASLKRLTPVKNGLMMLQDKLLLIYPKDHEVILYEASTLPIMLPRVESIKLCLLFKAKISQITTLYIKPVSTPPLDEVFCNKWEIEI